MRLNDEWPAFIQRDHKRNQREKFDDFAEQECVRFYKSETMGRPSIAPGVYFRMLMVGYFEGIDSERGIAWRCADSLSLKSFLGYALTETIPIVRRDTGEGYTEFLTKLAKASGIETPTREELAKLDRKRAKKGSNEEWEHPDDPDVKITKMKDGQTHLAHKAEHAVDMETGAVLVVTLQDEIGTTATGR